ncbi:MAG: enoyl-CoA hydratase/isomerase family protein [Bdellovibrionota bacterium]
MFIFEEYENIEIIRLKHGKVNALDIEFLSGLIELLESRISKPTPLVFTGQNNIFSAGVDLVRITKEGSSYLEKFVPLISNFFLKLFTYPAPTLAAVNGHAIAGGCILACACDYRVMAEGSGKIGVPELIVGVPFPTAPLEILRHCVSGGNFSDLVYTGRRLKPDEAIQIGLINEVVPTEQLETIALERAKTFSKVPKDAYLINKKMIQQPTIDRIASLSEKFDSQVEKIWLQEETLNAIKTYIVNL